MPSLESFEDGRPSYKCVECKSALSLSKLPGLNFAMNPYRGCAHGCAYCYAPYVMRVPMAEWTKVSVKENMPAVLAREVPRPGVVGLGTVTDPYQPLEKATCLTRRCLEVLRKAETATSVLTKSALVTRDLDILRRMKAVEVGITVTTIDDELGKALEPGASLQSERLRAARELVDAGVPTYIFLGPIIPLVTDDRLDDLISAIADTGVKRVMADRLNLRPGMGARITEALARADPSLAERAAPLLDDPGHYSSVMSRIEREGKARGLEVSRAF
ncbi:SPL family radical SAM protein [Methanomassiliicoccus luminyensis]|jgi:DNA repair photolyase|uniref:SPL family radical SAM protein n=1 Tax=Methanomassiliicoccus luminyensis TaxID=1080712 RepID=UPI00036140C3|nr:radical SAM protein [Methanomassiliicoccus luminyensis]